MPSLPFTEIALLFGRFPDFGPFVLLVRATERWRWLWRVDKLALVQVFLKSPSVLPCQYHSTNIPYSSSPTCCSYQQVKYKLNINTFTNSFPIPQRTYCLSITETDQLILFRLAVSVYYGTRRKLISEMCGQNEVLNVIVYGKRSNQCA